jgi:HD superfamily phosphohydrolase YqeK
VANVARPGRPPTDPGPGLHPVVESAARGDPPDWTEASRKRRAHMGRVADLMGRWARAFDLDDRDIARWRAAGILHDALREAEVDTLRPLVEPEMRDLPGKMLHGPAAAARLRADGVRDDALLRAVAWHTLGHPDFDRLGRALYLADYLEPGRKYDSDRLARLRDRVPRNLDKVLRKVASLRIQQSIDQGCPLLETTTAFWNGIVDG